MVKLVSNKSIFPQAASENTETNNNANVTRHVIIFFILTPPIPILSSGYMRVYVPHLPSLLDHYKISLHASAVESFLPLLPVFSLCISSVVL